MAGKSEAYIQAIWDATYALQDEQQMENGLSTCLTILGNTVGCEAGFAWLYDSRDQRMYVVACHGKIDVTGVSIGVSQGIIGTVFHNQQPMRIDKCSTDPRFNAAEDEETGFRTDTLLCVPLKTAGNIFGCLQMINKSSGVFSEEDEELAGNIAALAAMDIEDKGYTVNMRVQKNPVISLRGVKKIFPSGESTITVLKGIDLDIYEGEFLVILGESGCGKTTMLNIIGGMDSLSEGTVTVDGKDFSHPTDRELTLYRRDFIGFIFQSYNLMPNLSALENIEFVAENCKNPISPEEALAVVGMSQRAGHFPSQMSGGQQQRISIARALAKNPRMILADEPTAALDFQTGQEVLVLVEKIVREQGKTVVMITHNAEIAKMADRVIKLRSGLISSVRINMKPLKAVEIIW
jgi:ABC-type lipoprotein export system ATPase subunit/putative methionine-R-sulfoxide reductase with GAF domain